MVCGQSFRPKQRNVLAGELKEVGLFAFLKTERNVSMTDRRGTGCEVVECELLKEICECAAGDTN
jgi:hypothetical protein